MRRALARPRPDARAPSYPAARFRARHVRIGVALTLATLAQIVGYLALGRPEADIAVIAVLAVLAAVANIGLGVFAPAVAAHRLHGVIFVAWAFSCTALVLVGAWLDGGERSPLCLLLFLPMLYAAQGYPPLGTLLLGTEGVLGFLIICALDSAPGGAASAVMAGTMVLATLMATLNAHNREAQARELEALTVLLASDAVHDVLTGCLNRRGFDDALEVEVARALRHDRPLSLLLADVDHLKDINDVLGHEAGDDALRRVAAVLEQVGRPGDVAARIGGDEFALVAPELPAGAAIGLADRVHAALRDQNGTSPVTVSIGVAALASDATAPSQLRRAADAAMYEAKRAGRNQTACDRQRVAAPPRMTTSGR